MTKPTITLKCPAAVHARADERVAEFSAIHNGKLIGGLISMFVTEAGALRVDIYRADPGVEVIVSEDIQVWRNGKKLEQAA